MDTATPWCVLRCLPALALISACTASSEAVRPPNNQLFFPTGLVVSPDQSVLFAVNSNSELRYDSGTISVIDLGMVTAVIDGTVGTDGCKPDDVHREIRVCDASRFMRTDAAVRIGNFATDIALQDFGGGKLRVIVPTRGDPSIAWADYDGQNLSCTAGSGRFSLCDDAHRLANVAGDPALPPIPEEPFGVFADPGPSGMDGSYAHGFAIVTHLTTGAVTLINSPGDGNAQVADVKTNVFAIDPLTGLRGATGVVGHSPGVDGDIVYVGSRSEARIQTFTVGRPVNNTLPYLLPGDFFFLHAVGGNAGGSTDTRGMRFSPGGNRMYLVNRKPPSIQIFDTSLGPSGFPLNAPSGASDICREASTLDVFDPGDGERAYVTCFQDGQVYVVDPNGASQVEDIIDVGRGPYAAVHVGPPLTKGSLLFVSNYLEDTIAVVDVTPSSPSRNRVVLRIGQPRVP